MRSGFEKTIGQLMSDDPLTKKLTIITAPSGSGKTTIVKELLAQIPALTFSVSATTRAARKTEIDGVDYHFLSVEDFERKIEEDAFAEYEMVYENKFYGTLKAKLSEIWNDKKYPLVDIDVQGALKLKRLYKADVLSIFIQAPSLAILAERLKKRGTETDDMITERLAKAEIELSMNGQFDQIVTNDNLEKAIYDCRQLIEKFLA